MYAPQIRMKKSSGEWNTIPKINKNFAAPLPHCDNCFADGRTF
jgi:hypothetical protein